ncbi:DUF4402 domain-containing protein [Sphingomicrobium clamense]|uniref:DUF4402 domain-containing protein n=1 Tax=Sphingomicrobium clamense TaxID=2851013 RepID=A0ABS6V480_9SPHN|nr:DUF4402 domain-containing protein [Sphingomicrobium sp. B8]MBW0144007.1 DUF4402 domain-containing protein [Sphingomicrobium sp. B8]
MNRILSTILAGIAFLCAVFAPGAAHAQATGDGGATVEIQTPVTSTKRSDLDFGTIHNAADGTVRIDPATGVLTTTGGRDADRQPHLARPFRHRPARPVLRLYPV